MTWALVTALFGCAATEPEPGVDDTGPSSTLETGDSDDTGAELPGDTGSCGDPESRTLGLDDPLDVGGTVAGVLAPVIDAPIVVQPSWADGVARELTITGAVVREEVVLIEVPGCPERSRLELTFAMTLSTADGLLDEAWTQSRSISLPANRIDFSFQRTPAEIEGRFDLAEWSPDADALVLWMGVGATVPSDDGGYLQANIALPDDPARDRRREGICGWGTSADSYDPRETVDTGI